MKALYVNDDAKGPGHGFLRISDLTEAGDLEGARCSIKRASDQKSLAPGGWQPAESFLPVRELSLTDNGIAVSVGPEVVDRLDSQEIYRLTLAFTDAKSVTGSLLAPEIAYSPQGGGQGIGTAASPQPSPGPEKAPATRIEEAPPPEPDLAPPPPQVEALPPPLPPARSGNNLLPVILLIAALALGGGAFAVWKFVPGSEEAPIAEAPSAVETQKEPIAEARAMLIKGADPAACLEAAKKFRDQPNGADAAF
ncbi:MAG: hypothetical protein LBH65_03600, partial [Desulfovibrio sp.]|nr:hypothetical protein [Desulfovibrio sp.]